MWFINRFTPLACALAVFVLLESIIKSPRLIYAAAPLILFLVFLSLWQLTGQKLRNGKLWRFLITPFIFIEPQGALASTYDNSLTESWVTPMSGSPLQINNLQVVENDRGSFADHVKISWQTNPNSPGSIGYLVTIWTSDDLGVTWTTYHLRHSDNPTENPHFFGATVGGCYSVIGKWIVDDFEPVPDAAFMNMYNGSCQGILFSQRTTMDYATIDTQNTITYSHFKFKQGSALVKNNFILQFNMMVAEYVVTQGKSTAKYKPYNSGLLLY